jgi:hypothetical protein
MEMRHVTPLGVRGIHLQFDRSGTHDSGQDGKDPKRLRIAIVAAPRTDALLARTLRGAHDRALGAAYLLLDTAAMDADRADRTQQMSLGEWRVAVAALDAARRSPGWPAGQGVRRRRKGEPMMPRHGEEH